MVRVSGSSSYRRVQITEGTENYSECMTEIQGKSILVRFSARFELTRVRVIGSRADCNINVNECSYKVKFPRSSYTVTRAKLVHEVVCSLAKREQSIYTHAQIIAFHSQSS